MYNAAKVFAYNSIGNIHGIDQELLVAKILTEQVEVLVQNGFDPKPFVETDWLVNYKGEQLYLNALVNALTANKSKDTQAAQKVLQSLEKTFGLLTVRDVKLNQDRRKHNLVALDNLFNNEEIRFDELDFLASNIYELPAKLLPYKNLLQDSIRIKFTKISVPLVLSGFGIDNENSQFSENSLGLILEQFAITYGIEVNEQTPEVIQFSKELKDFISDLLFYFKEYLDVSDS